MIASGPVVDVESIVGGGASVAGNARVVLRVCSAPVRGLEGSRRGTMSIVEESNWVRA